MWITFLLIIVVVIVIGVLWGSRAKPPPSTLTGDLASRARQLQTQLEGESNQKQIADAREGAHDAQKHLRLWEKEIEQRIRRKAMSVSICTSVEDWAIDEVRGISKHELLGRSIEYKNAYAAELRSLLGEPFRPSFSTEEYSDYSSYHGRYELFRISWGRTPLPLVTGNVR